MKNLLNEKPKEESDLEGRLKYSCEYVSDIDLRGKAVLDIGCGFGWFEKFCLKEGVTSVKGMELTENDLKTAIANVTNERASFHPGSAIEIPFADNSFDTVVSWEVIEHIPRKTEDLMFREIKRVLKPGGVFYMSTPYRSFLSTVMDPAWWLVGHRHYREKDLIEIGKNAGFSCMDSRLRGGIWEIFTWWNLYISKWVFRRGLFFEKYFLKKIDQEFRGGEKGFTNIFQRYQAH